MNASDANALCHEVRALRQEMASLRAAQRREARPPSFHWELLLGVVACNLVWSAYANDFVDGLLGVARVHGDTAEIQLAPCALLLPLAALAYYDCTSNASKRFLHCVSDATMNYVLRARGPRPHGGGETHPSYGGRRSRAATASSRSSRRTSASNPASTSATSSSTPSSSSSCSGAALLR